MFTTKSLLKSGCWRVQPVLSVNFWLDFLLLLSGCLSAGKEEWRGRWPACRWVRASQSGSRTKSGKSLMSGSFTDRLRVQMTLPESQHCQNKFCSIDGELTASEHLTALKALQCQVKVGFKWIPFWCSNLGIQGSYRVDGFVKPILVFFWKNVSCGNKFSCLHFSFLVLVKGDVRSYEALFLFWYP